jgi:uncharacterized protein
LRVIWDPAKNLINRRKHGVSFEEASTLFTSGVDYFEVFDELHSVAEDRFIAIGPIVKGLVLVVYSEREEDGVRIISARWATQGEISIYRSHIGV